MTESDRTPLRWHTFPTPLGQTYIAFAEQGLVELSWHVSDEDTFQERLRRRFPENPIVRDPDAGQPIERVISEFLAGRDPNLNLTIDLSTLSEFERSVLEATRTVPYGSTVSYAELARRVGRPGAARAVGNALRRNPVPLIVPCHRVIRRDGSPGGFGGPDGSAEKLRLLALEQGGLQMDLGVALRAEGDPDA